MAYAIYAVVMLFAIVSVYVQYRTERELRLKVLTERTHEAFSELNDLVTLATDEMRGVAFAADDFYAMKGHSRLRQRFLIEEVLQPSEHFEGFALDQPPPSLKLGKIGNLSGLGEPERFEESHLRELELAFLLNSHFREARAALPHVQRAYYISARHFHNVHPWAPSSESGWSPDRHQHEAYRLGLPEGNPGREPYWTDPYADPQGDGLIVTLGMPIYEGDIFRGVAALDLSLVALSEFVHKKRIDYTAALVLNDRGQLIADPLAIDSGVTAPVHAHQVLPEGLHEPLATLHGRTDADFVQFVDHIVWSHRLEHAPWDYIIYIETATLSWNTLRDMVLEAAIVIFLVLSLAAIERARVASRDLRERTRELQVAMDNMPGGMAMLDDDLRFVTFNDAYRSLLGLPRELLSAGSSLVAALRHVVRARDGEATAEEEAAVETALLPYKARESTSFDQELADRLTLQVNVRPIAEGGLVSVLTDITDRTRAERQLRDAYSVIQDSVTYASHIQRSLLPRESVFDRIGPEHFVIWEPRDVVGGDFYWVRQTTQGMLLVVGDCTGHGVPGAFMTILATGALERALSRHADGDPALLIAEMNRVIKRALRQDEAHGLADDGLELGVCRIEAGRRASFAGARFSLWLAEDGEVREIKGDKVGIGYRRAALDIAVSKHTVELKPGATLYFASDGMVDQIGDARRRAFGRRRLRELLEAVQHRPFAEQRVAILDTLAAWQGRQSRRDDVTVLGVRPG